MRVFIAIELPYDIIKKIKDLQEGLKKHCKTKVSWSKPENIHFTLKFLGDVKENKIESVKTAMNNACNNINPFMLSAGNIGYFPDLNKPRVIWVGIKAYNDLLDNIYEDMEQGLSKIGFKKESRKFNLHLTLGRIKYYDSASGLKTAVERLKDVSIGEFMVKSIALFKSELNPKGAIYTKLYECNLD